MNDISAFLYLILRNKYLIFYVVRHTIRVEVFANNAIPSNNRGGSDSQWITFTNEYFPFFICIIVEAWIEKYKLYIIKKTVFKDSLMNMDEIDKVVV